MNPPSAAATSAASRNRGVHDLIELGLHRVVLDHDAGRLGEQQVGRWPLVGHVHPAVGRDLQMLRQGYMDQKDFCSLKSGMLRNVATRSADTRASVHIAWFPEGSVIEEVFLALASASSVSVLTSVIKVWLDSRRRRNAARRVSISIQGDSIEVEDAKEVISKLLDAGHRKILNATPEGVALDVGQIGSAAQFPPSETKALVAELVQIGALEEVLGENREVRFRKLLADELTGGEK